MALGLFLIRPVGRFPMASWYGICQMPSSPQRPAEPAILDRLFHLPAAACGFVSRMGDVSVPILAAEPSVFPMNLFSLSEHTSAGAEWWVLHTRPRAEKALARRLFTKQIAFFLPVYQQHRNSEGRAPAHLPLFPGYLFLCGPQEALHTALETKLVANC